MKTLTFISILAAAGTFSSAIRADDGKIKLDAPESWPGETIELPPRFAPDMKLKGTEEIRFAPGMFDAKSETFFTYVFVFRLKKEPEVTEKVLRREMLAYYRGLAKAVIGSQGGEVDTKKFSLKLKKAKDADGKDKPPQGVTAYAGELDWVEPFVTKKPQSLRLEIHTWSPKQSKHAYLFCCVSPRKQDSAPWKQLRKIRDSFHKTLRDSP